MSLRKFGEVHNGTPWGLPGGITMEEAERMARIENVLRVRARATRRGSWFDISRYYTPSQVAEYRAMLQDKARCKSDPKLQSLEPFDVICMHCQKRVTFLNIEHLRQSSGNVEHHCVQCSLPLWIPHVFKVAKVAYAVTGDFQSFEKMLIYPPENLDFEEEK